jgi:CheY-like chemotaxis protein
MTGGAKRAPQVLIVEDERIVAADLESTLRSLGYRVIGIASSSDRAIELATQNVPDIALMDIRIKGAVDGIETAALLRERFGTPIVFLTAYSDDETLARARAVSPAGYLLKPFSDDELRAALEIALGAHHSVVPERSES